MIGRIDSNELRRQFSLLCNDCLKEMARANYPEAIELWNEIKYDAPPSNQEEGIHTCWGSRCYNTSKGIRTTIIPTVMVEEDFDAREEIREELIFEMDEEYQSNEDNKPIRTYYETRSNCTHQYYWYSGELYETVDETINEDILVKI